MKRKIAFILLSISMLSCASCSRSNTESNNNSSAFSQESVEPSSSQKQEESETPSTQTSANMKNVALSTVPNEFYSRAAQQGALETFTYDTKDYIGNGRAIQSRATVYLPYGYDQNDIETKYNILYLQHGAYGNERTWMYEYGNNFKKSLGLHR